MPEPRLKFPRWVPEPAREVLQRAYGGTPSAPRRALIERLATSDQMETVWRKLTREPRDAAGTLMFYALFYAGDESLHALLEPKRIRTREDALYAGTKTPTFLSLSIAANSARTLRDNARRLKGVWEAGWAEGWRGDPNMTPDKLLKVLDDAAGFFKWLNDPVEALIRATPRIVKRSAKDARRLAYTRALSNFAQCLFGRPCDEAVIALVEVVFDLPEGLSAETVRSLRRRHAG